MKKYWYRRILIMALVFFVSVGGSYLLIEQKKDAMRREVSAQTSEEDLVIPGGMPVGIYMKTKGVMVLDTQKIKGEDGAEYEPALHIVKAGDYITGFNGKDINTKNELVEAVSSFSEQKAKLDICRKGETIHVKMDMIQCEDGTKKLGIWVRDNAQGLGTITYLDSDSHFGALGHGIHDIDTGELLNISDGTLYLTSVKEIQKGVNGTPGGMEGIIVYNNYNVLGKIKKNTEAGIFGTIDRVDVLFANQTPVQLAKKEEVEEGPAIIRCAVDGEIKEYNILITQVNLWSGEVNKSMTIEVTDPLLLDETGGIIQGMSGSPILQNGKLIGAVTHVFVNNPTKGYGIFAESMINKKKKKIPCREVIELSDSNFLIRKKEKIIIKSNEK